MPDRSPPPPPVPSHRVLLRLSLAALVLSLGGGIGLMGIGGVPWVSLADPLARAVLGRAPASTAGANVWPFLIYVGLLWPWFIPLLWPVATRLGPPRSWGRWLGLAALVAVASTALALGLILWTEATRVVPPGR